MQAVKLAPFLMLLSSCHYQPPKEVCSRLYRRCVDESENLRQYQDCREQVDAACLSFKP